MITSYHTHSILSDGSSTLDEMILAARMQGVDELGFSDHYTLSPGGPVCWSMAEDALEGYVAAVRERIAATTEPVIRLGVEADYFPETIDTLAARLATYPFDYIIGSVHLVDGFSVDTDATDWEPLTEEERNAVWRTYYARIRALAATGLFDILGHLDLPKKFGFLPTIDLSADIADTLDALAAADMALELNTAGWHKPIGEAYPSLDLLREARRRDLPLVITADAHSATDLIRDYDRARALALRAGYEQAARFARRERVMAGM